MNDLSTLALLLAAILALVVLSAMWSAFRGVTMIALGVLFATTLLPTNLLDANPEPYVGIAAAQIVPSTINVTVGVALCVLIVKVPHLRDFPIEWVPFISYLLLATWVIWTMTPLTASGLLELSLAPVAWWLGKRLGQGITQSTADILSSGSSIIVAIQAAAVGFQVVGLMPLSSAGGIEADSGRYSGLLYHPDMLGKVLFFVMALLLGLFPFCSRRVRMVSVGSVVVGLSLGLATGGRAIMAAMAVLVVISSWRSAGTAKRGDLIRALLVALLVFATFAAGFIERLREDPNGGARGELFSLGLTFLASTGLFGVGPNRYVEYVGQYDRLTASGVPVHNAFLLLAVEVGTVGAALLLIPLAKLAVGSLLVAGRRPLGISVHGVVIGSTLGWAVIAWTGWGVVGGYVLPLSMLVFGTMDGIQRRHALEFTRRTTNRLNPSILRHQARGRQAAKYDS